VVGVVAVVTGGGGVGEGAPVVDRSRPPAHAAMVNVTAAAAVLRAPKYIRSR
jgi:hypothetical protein